MRHVGHYAVNQTGIGAKQVTALVTVIAVHPLWRPFWRHAPSDTLLLASIPVPHACTCPQSSSLRSSVFGNLIQAAHSILSTARRVSAPDRRPVLLRDCFLRMVTRQLGYSIVYTHAMCGGSILGQTHPFKFTKTAVYMCMIPLVQRYAENLNYLCRI